MAVVTIRQCDLCDRCSSEDSIFEVVGGVDMCATCLHIFKRAVELNLIIIVSSPLEEE